MAGKNQHFLPQFLQKGFSSRVNGKEIYTWVYRRGTSPFESNIKNIGSSRYFYGNPNEELSVDPEITKQETKFANYIEKLRNKSEELELEKSIITEFVTHLIIRTQFIRTSLSQSIDYFLDYILEELPQNCIDYLIEHPEILYRNLEQQLERQGIKNLGSLAKDVIVLHFKNVLTNEANESNRELKILLDKFLLSNINELKKNLPSLVRTSHISTLSQNISPEPRINFFRRFNWFLIIRKKGSFILSDVGSISKLKNSDQVKAVPDKLEKIDQIFLPISDTHLVVGCRSRKIKKVNVNIRHLQNINYEIIMENKSVFEVQKL
ncbi:DUF4238 domain-containing protein [Lyngbya aestuarii]|uniref:DUF4238 domain-containing protein n=1 Tax=Lyngbya aestuarii TaxID=118322 RepID=UPI00403E2C82